MSKSLKKVQTENRTTLDNLHQIQISNLQKEKESMDSIEDRLSVLKDEIANCQDIVIKTKKENEYEELKKRQEDWKKGTPIFDYFFNTGEILYDYYDLQEKIQKGEARSVTKAKVKPGSVLAALHSEESSQQEALSFTAPLKSSKGTGPGREILLDQYLRKVDPEQARAAPNAIDDPYGICDSCEKEMTFSANEALFFCPACGTQEFVLIDSDKPSYKDPPREVTYYAYKRINHFNEWLAQFQAKESTEIPDSVFNDIVTELKKERVMNPETIKPAKIREILKKLKCTNYYEHVPYILNKINGRTAPVMGRDIEEKLRFMFREIQSSFIKHCPKNRSNFLSYSYVLYKFCELLELDEYLQCFPLLKNRDKLYNQDKIWEKICEDLKWQFIRSI